jgi:DNA polymerase-1
MSHKRIFLIDGSALVYRSFHAFSGRAQLTSRGQDVGMVFGFLSSLLMVLRREKPDRLVVAFDTGAPTFRHKMYDAYKANRPPMAEELRGQLPLLTELLTLLNIPQIGMDGYEADDVMGTLACRAAAEGMDAFLVTGDKDFYQLVNDQIKVYTLPYKGSGAPTIYDSEGVLTKFGVPPDKVTDVLALMGDASDNVPGVPNVGSKTAVELINQFGTLEAVLAAAQDIKQPRLRQNLTEFADQARFSRELVIIDTNAPVDVEPASFKAGPLNNPAARHKLAEYEFRSLLTQLDKIEPVVSAEATLTLPSEETTEPAYRTVTDPAGLTEMLSELTRAELVSVDVETTSLDAMRAELVGMSFSVSEGEAWYIAANHFEGVPDDWQPPPPPQLRPHCSREVAFILSQLRPFYTDPSIPKTGQNLKYDALVLACYDVEVAGIAFDTMIASHLLDPSARQHNIDLLAQTHLNFRKIPTESLIGSGSKQISMADVPVAKVSHYACEDADVALRLTNLFKPNIAASGLERIFYEQELPLMPVLLTMEKRGVKLDTDLLGQMSVEFQRELDGLESEVKRAVGFNFNLNSTQQLADVLFGKLGLPPGKKTKFGFSTDADELERLAPVHEVPRLLLRYRHLAKLKSTYIDALPVMVHPITGRVHTSYNQTIAATGRLSSTDPNLQNIPIRTEEGGQIRRAFIAGEPGWVIVSADYSQIELRVMAHLSGDERLLEAFREGQDIHRATAAWMMDVPPELVTSDMRRQAKEVNFGVLYGMGDFGLAQRLGISRQRAREFIDQYFGKFARVKEYIDELHERTRQLGYVETIMGRRRPLPEINAKNFQVRQNAQRIAINTPIQGSAADLIKKAMTDVHHVLLNEGFEARMLMQVHDELVFEAPRDELEKLSARLKEIMSGAMELKVPLDVGVSWGENWLDAHD